MLKKIILAVVVFQLSACAELQQVINQLPNGELTNFQIAAGLKEALQNGISNQVTTLAVQDGFFKNEMVKILLPAELQKVDRTLRGMGLSSLADEGQRVLNRAAEDAVGEAIPIFTDAITGMTIVDAKNILLGDKNSATLYLKTATSAALYQKFNPIINNSFKKVGADVFITADVKYHEFFDAESKLILCDIGHYESEIFTKLLLGEILSQNFPNIALYFTRVVTNPTSYR